MSWQMTMKMMIHRMGGMGSSKRKTKSCFRMSAEELVSFHRMGEMEMSYRMTATRGMNNCSDFESFRSLAEMGPMGWSKNWRWGRARSMTRVRERSSGETHRTTGRCMSRQRAQKHRSYLRQAQLHHNPAHLTVEKREHRLYVPAAGRCLLGDSS